MAFEGNRNGGGRGPRGGQGGGSYGPPPPRPAVPKELPEDYVMLAEDTVQKLAKNRQGNKFLLTTSKIRSILAMVSEVYNAEAVRTVPELLADSVTKLRRVQVRLVYEAGREPAVKDLVEKGELLCYLKGIGTSREAFLRYAGYLEALTAYHRYYGGDN